MANRRAARELLMRAVYQMSVTGDWSEDAREAFLEENACDDGVRASLADAGDRSYFDGALGAVRDHVEEIDALIGDASEHWKIGRIAKVDLAILRLAAGEMLYARDIPVSVSINEAVELSRKYGGDKSYEFVNGVLGRIARTAAPEDGGASEP